MIMSIIKWISDMR